MGGSFRREEQILKKRNWSVAVGWSTYRDGRSRSHAVSRIVVPIWWPLDRGRRVEMRSHLVKKEFRGFLTRRDREVVGFTRYRVKNNTELTNLMKMYRIQGYNGKYRSNPQGIKQFLDVIFKFDQIGREIDGRNWGKWHFMKDNFKTNPRNQKS